MSRFVASLLTVAASTKTKQSIMADNANNDILIPDLPPIDEETGVTDAGSEADENSITTIGFERKGPGIAWGDQGYYYLGSNITEWVASTLTDKKGNQIALNNKDSIYFALEQLNFCDIVLPPKSYSKKIPTHILATNSWDASLTNIMQFCMMNEKERGLEMKRFKDASEGDKKNWNRLIKRLHKNRRSIFNPPTSSPQSPSTRPQLLQSPRPQRVSVRARQAAIEAATQQATAHASDPERIQRVRELVGYDGDLGDSNNDEPTSERALRRQRRDQARRQLELEEYVEDHRGLGEDITIREGLTQDEFNNAKKYIRKFGTPPNTVGQQTDSASRLSVASALAQVGKHIDTIHFPNNDDSEQPVHSMVLVILNEVEKQTNKTGSKCNPGKKADKSELTVLAYDNETCVKVIKALCDQFLETEDDDNGEFVPLIAQRPFNEHIIFKNENQTLRESVETYLDLHSDGTWRQPKRKVRSNNEIQASITPGANTQQRPVFTTTPQSVNIAIQARENNAPVVLQSTHDNDCSGDESN